MSHGTVAWFSARKGFGYIAPDDGSAAIFVHFTAILGEDTLRFLNPGQAVSFDVVLGTAGRQAQSVRPD
jgi:CspA family cold shock protein